MESVTESSSPLSFLCYREALLRLGAVMRFLYEAVFYISEGEGGWRKSFS